VLPSSNTTPTSRGIQLDPNVTVKEEFGYFPTVRPYTGLAQIARFLVTQLDAQTPPVQPQMTELQTRIALLTVQLKDQNIVWKEQVEQKDAALEREQIARKLDLEREEEHVAAMKTRLAEINRHCQKANLAYQTQ
jgi:hypothetical protein